MIVTNPRTAYDQRASEVRQRIIDLCLALAEHAKEAGEAVSGYGIKFSMGAAADVTKQIEELASLGVSPFKLEQSTANT